VGRKTRKFNIIVFGISRDLEIYDEYWQEDKQTIFSKRGYKPEDNNGREIKWKNNKIKIKENIKEEPCFSEENLRTPKI
jgi:dTDP-4-dehydrorhamnose 3,5-epimerase-like enzyme